MAQRDGDKNQTGQSKGLSLPLFLFCEDSNLFQGFCPESKPDPRLFTKVCQQRTVSQNDVKKDHSRN